MSEVKQKNININCSDNYELTGTLFTPSTNIRAAVLFAPATGIKRGFYSALASYLADQGYASLTFDNRGIGDSLVGHIKDSQATLKQWGELDMTAAFAALQKHFPHVSYHLLGHSAGGQLVGLMKNAGDLSSMFNFACSSGRMKLMPFPYVLVARFFMQVFMPLSNLILGYAKNDLVGMGEPLPKKVSQDWTDWCAGQGYVKTAFGKTIQNHLYDELDFPSKWIIALDDAIANEKTLDDMLSVFKKLPAEKQVLVPSEYGKKDIGHMKFFSRKNKDLWGLATNWLEQHS